MKKFVVTEEDMEEVQKHLEDYLDHIYNSLGCLRMIHARRVYAALQQLKSCPCLNEKVHKDTPERKKV